MPIPAPPHLHQEPVRPEWIEYDGRMNVAYYVPAFDRARAARRTAAFASRKDLPWPPELGRRIAMPAPKSLTEAGFA